MASRLGILDEMNIDYEVPYITRRGEKIGCTSVQINERRCGVNVSYALLSPSNERLDKLFPAEGVDYLAALIKQILNDLDAKTSEIILQLWEYSPVNALYSIEGRAPVSRQRDTVLIILSKTPFVYKFGYELVLWHQAMHAKDRLESRFPSTHPWVDVGQWLDVLWHFSIDGRLQVRNNPHYTKSERLDEANKLLNGLCRDEGLPSKLKVLCDEMWGSEVTFNQLLEVGKELGLGVSRKGYSEEFLKI